MTSLKQYRLALQIFQSNRLRRDYRDLSEIPEYNLLGEFFFNEMYGPRDFSARDSGARRLNTFLHLVPGVHLDDVMQVLKLLDLTNTLDQRMAMLLMDRQAGLGFTEDIYDECYRELNNYDERLEQLHLIDGSIRNVFRLSRYAVIGTALSSVRMVAKVSGLDAIYQFLVKGYYALRGVRDIEPFATAIQSRELVRLNRVYGIGLDEETE